MNWKRMLLAGAAALVTLSTHVAFAAPKDAVGNVYTMTNAPTGNEIVMFDRDAKGALTAAGSIVTGGLGSGGGADPLVSQGSLMLTDNGRFLLAVNAGSNDVSVFRVRPDGLHQTDQTASGGEFPVSIAVYHDLVYVLNGHGTPNVTGFVLDHNGELSAIPNGTRALGAGSFAQVGFAPDGNTLIVTGRTNDEILTYAVDRDGLPSVNAVTTPSSGAGPFGFTFDHRGNLLVVEAGTNAVSSYSIGNDGTLDVISASVANGQTASCWIAGNDKHFFTANPGTHTLSSYAVKQGHGTLQLQDATAGAATRPLDIGVSKEGRYLYALDSAQSAIVAFEIRANGTLMPLGAAPSAAIETFAQGLAAR